MIIQFRLKLDRFYYTGAMNQLKKIFFVNLKNYCIKISYYQYNRQEILQKVKERYSKEKAAEYYLQNKEAIKKKSREHYKSLLEEEKDKIKGGSKENVSRTNPL